MRRLADDLKRYGIDVWLDVDQIEVGDSLLDSIERALNSCDYAIVALSAAALKRPWVQRELRALHVLEISRGKKVILPVLLEQVDLPLFLQDKKYTDLSADYENAVQELLRVFRGPDKSRALDLETLQCEVVVDILSADGSRARPVKRQRIRALEQPVHRYLDVCSADGEITDIKLEPGQIEKVWKENGSVYVESSFPTPLMPGDEIDISFDSVFIDSFLGEEEYWEARQYHPTRDLHVCVQFPSDRPPYRFWAYEKRGPNQIDLSGMLDSRMRSGRRELHLIMDNSSTRLLSSYVIRWVW